MIVSPLRYPGGKSKLYAYFIALIRENKLFGKTYCEPYAGGGGLALKLLENGFVSSVVLNDIDRAVYAFWKSALRNTDSFCALIEDTPVTVDEWYRQYDTFSNRKKAPLLELGFAAYFLNRTNRSGIIEGAGPIGGYNQQGPWKIDVRFNKDAQIRNLELISGFSSQIKLTNRDALDFATDTIIDRNVLIYFDPPYYVKGHKLYTNFYQHKDHKKIAQFLNKNRSKNWVLSYDDTPEIRSLYSKFLPIEYGLNYSAGAKSKGREVIYLSIKLKSPAIPGFRVAA